MFRESQCKFQNPLVSNASCSKSTLVRVSSQSPDLSIRQNLQDPWKILHYCCQKFQESWKIFVHFSCKKCLLSRSEVSLQDFARTLPYFSVLTR